MSKSWFRTHCTPLSDDELLLLDVMFDADVAFSMLEIDRFPRQFNTRSHSLDEQQLRATVQHLIDRGFVRETDAFFRDSRYLTITPIGGELWSQERCPVWDRYCTDHYHRSVPGREMMTVLSTTSRTRDDYLQVIAPVDSRIRTVTIRNHSLLSWLDFTPIHVGLATYPQTSNWARWPELWDGIERDRTWWGNVRELQRFVGDHSSSNAQ